MEAIDLSAPAPFQRTGLGYSETEFRSAFYGCCETRIALTDIERALFRVARDLPARFCPECSRRMPIVSKPDTVDKCTLCDQAIEQTAGGDNIAVVVFLDGRTPSWAHSLCARKKAHRKLPSLAAVLTTSELPDCALCGQPYVDGHNHLLGSIWDSWCNTEGPELQFYRPSQPFRSRDYPYDLITDSPRYA